MAGFSTGWALRESNSQVQKQNNADKYKWELQKMFDADALSKAHKMSAPAMRERFIQDYDQRF